MVPWHMQQEDLVRFSHYETHWTTTVDNVGMKTDLAGTWSSMVILTLLFPIMQTAPPQCLVAGLRRKCGGRFLGWLQSMHLLWLHENHRNWVHGFWVSEGRAFLDTSCWMRHLTQVPASRVVIMYGGVIDRAAWWSCGHHELQLLTRKGCEQSEAELVN